MPKNLLRILGICLTFSLASFETSIAQNYALDVSNSLGEERVYTSKYGHKVTETGMNDLITVAGVRAGALKVKKLPKGYITEGVFLVNDSNKKLMEKIYKEADGDNNKKITDEEAKNLLNKTLEEATK